MRARTAFVAAVGVAAVIGGGILLGPSAAVEAEPDAVRNVTVRNQCPERVWLFYGREPPLRDQDAVDLGSRTSRSQAMLEGDIVWLLDEDRTVWGHAEVSADTQEIRIHSSCHTIAAY